MITLSQSLQWLNREDQGHLTHKSQLSLWQVRDTNILDSEKDRIVEALIYDTHSPKDPFEKAEVLLNCAEIQSGRNRHSEAEGYISKAIRFYEAKGDPYRTAVTRWMLHLVWWKLLANNMAHNEARMARKIFTDLRKVKSAIPDVTSVKWFTEQIDQMDEDLISTPEEAYEWLTQFEESHLESQAHHTSYAISDAMLNKRFSHAYQKMEQLLEITQGSLDPKETGEALAFCGLTAYQTGNCQEAVRLIRHACATYSPEGHHQAATRWMLGMVQWSMPNGASKAIQTCSNCISYIEKLRIRADQKNRAEERDWYAEHLPIMKSVLTKKIQSM